jgi:O-antigen ligase/tetratricopeptide (TPR) repeat protein
MKHLVIFIVCLALAVAGTISITLSVPLQAPSVVLFGLAGMVAVIVFMLKGGGGSGSWLLGWALVATGYFVARACYSPVWDLGVEDLMLILPAGILYLIAGYMIAGKHGALLRQALAYVVVVLLLLHVGAAVMQLSGSEGYSLSRVFTGAERASPGHVTGMYGYYGSLANFLVIAGLLCLSLGVWGRFSYSVRTAVFLLGLGALGLSVWTQSRSAVVSLVVALIVFGVLMSLSLAKQEDVVRRRIRRALLVLATSGVMLGCVGGVWVFEKRGGASIDEISYSGVRSQFWAMAAEQWVDDPLVGGGSRSYSYECFRYWSPNLPIWQANPEFVHNEYLQLLADYGLIGGLLILGLFVGHLVIGVRRVHKLSGQVGESGLKRGSNAMALAMAGVCGMVAMAVHVTFDFRTHLLANLLLLVCCAVWVLPVAKPIVWKSGSPEVRKSRMGSWCLGFVMMVLGLGAISLGGQQFWGGLPLIEHRMAKEHGAWVPQEVNRGVWISVLEESVDRNPNWIRYQRLGTLYRLEGCVRVGVSKQDVIEKSIKAYELSIERHPHNPIPWINLASIYAQAEQWQKADEAYAYASEWSKARERWFRMHSEWALLHQRWAMDLWKKGDFEDAERHLLIAKKYFKLSSDYGYMHHNKKWLIEYSRLLICHGRMLDSQKRFLEAESHFQEAFEQHNWVSWQRDTHLNMYYAQHLYEQGKAVWYLRKPEEAYRIMKMAKVRLLQYRTVMKGNVESSWSEQLAEIQKVIDFLEVAGVTNQ